MNILTTNGFVGRYVTDWAGPGARHRVGVHPPGRPQLPGRHHGLHRRRSPTRRDPDRTSTTAGAWSRSPVRGANSRGDHVTGTVRLSVLPLTTRAPREAGVMSARSPRHHSFAGTTAISGIGATEFSKDSGRSELRLATEAVRRRPRRRRPRPRPTSTAWSPSRPTPTPRSRWPAPWAWATSPSSAASTTAAGPPAPPCTRPPWPSPAGWPTWSSATGPSTSARATASAPASRAGAPVPTPRTPTSPGTRPRVCSPRPPGWPCSPSATCTSPGATTEDFGRVAVADRAHAATNPAAWFYGKPITLEDHQASRWIVEPAASARLLPGVRRRPGHRRHEPRAGP